MGSKGALGIAGLCALVAACAATAAPAPKPPKLQTATAVGDRVNLTFTGALKPGRGAWAAKINGKPVDVAGVTFAGRRAQLRLATSAYSDDVVRVVGSGLRSAKGARLKTVAATPVNRSSAGCSEQLGTVVEGQPREGPTDLKTFLPASRFRFYVVRVDFPDFPRPTPPPPFVSPPTMDLTALDSLVRDLSYGRSSVASTGFQGNIRMSKNAREYAHSGAWSDRRALVQEVVGQLDPTVDFREYDGLAIQMDLNRGPIPRPVLDPVAVAPPGQGIPVDGKELRHVMMGFSSTGLLRPLLQLAGLPSLGVRDVSRWDPMYFNTQLGLLAWHHRKLGWLRPNEVRCLREQPAEVTLEPTWRGGGTKALIVPIGSSNAVVLENRQQQGVDATACSRGLLPYRVDTQAATSPIVVLNSDPPAGPCRGDFAPYDVTLGQKLRIADTVTFEVLAIEADGTYRLRVSRAP